MPNKSVMGEAREIQRAIEWVQLGARLQFLEAETNLSRDRLIKLYKEIKGASPPKGLLPFSTDWFMTWMANIHSSMFYNIYRFMVANGAPSPTDAFTKSYQLYLEQVQQLGGEVVLDFTRAWTMVRFFEGDLLQLSTCTRCTGQFVAHAHDGKPDYVCVLCRPPSRAGKLRRVESVDAVDASQPVPPAVPKRKQAQASAASSSQWLAQVMRSAHA
jgi:flagellar transcriptional activator FlhC